MWIYTYTCICNIYKHLHLGLLYVIANGSDDYGKAFKTAFDRLVLTFDGNDDIKSVSGGNSTGAREREGRDEALTLTESIEGVRIYKLYMHVFFSIYTHVNTYVYVFYVNVMN